MAAPISRHQSARSRAGGSAADLSRVGFDATSEVMTCAGIRLSLDS
jgi:hypothetical protein